MTGSPNPHHGTAKKIIHLPKPKAIAAASNAFAPPPPEKQGIEGYARLQLHLSLHQTLTGN